MILTEIFDGLTILWSLGFSEDGMILYFVSLTTAEEISFNRPCTIGIRYHPIYNFEHTLLPLLSIDLKENTTRLSGCDYLQFLLDQNNAQLRLQSLHSGHRRRLNKGSHCRLHGINNAKLD
jgi:hypothetical protein